MKAATPGRDIYLNLCEAGDLSAAVRALSIDDLTAVAEYLGKSPRRGISAQVWGEVQQSLTERSRS